MLIAACFGGMLVALALSSMFPRAAGAATVPTTSLTALPSASGAVGPALSGPGALGHPSMQTGTPAPPARPPALRGASSVVATNMSSTLAPTTRTLTPVVAVVSNTSEGVPPRLPISVKGSVGSIARSVSNPNLPPTSEVVPPRTTPTRHQEVRSASSSEGQLRGIAQDAIRPRWSANRLSAPEPRRPVPGWPRPSTPLVPGLPLSGSDDVGMNLPTQGSGAQAGYPSRAPLSPAFVAWARSRELLGGPGILTVPALSPPG